MDGIGHPTEITLQLKSSENLWSEVNALEGVDFGKTALAVCFGEATLITGSVTAVSFMALHNSLFVLCGR